MASIKERLSREDREVLRLIAGSRRRPQASDIVDVAEWTDDTRAVHYRFNKLCDLDLLDKQKRGDERLDPVTVGLTELGESVAADLDDRSERASVEERLDRYEERLDVISSTYTEVKRRIVEIEEQLDEFDDDLDGVAEEVVSLRRFVEEQDSE